MRILISSIGSRGDVQPILGLALELRALGHTATLCVAPNFKPWVESHGIACVPLGPDVKQFMRQNIGTRRKAPSRDQLRKLVPQSVREQFQVLGEAARGCDLLVGANALQTAGPSIAESLRIPYVFAAYCPATFPSPAHPPPMIRPQWLPRVVNRLLWSRSARAGNRLFRDVVNEQRTRLGLSPIQHIERYVSTARPWLAADPALAPAVPSAGKQFTQTGAWFLPDSTPLPDDLERFLREGEAPIYFGLGSMMAQAEMPRLFVEAARALGRRAVILKGWADLTLADAGGSCLAIGEVNHSQLFPRVAAIVHHGGAGTTTAATRAGKPQVALPGSYDQYYWAHRVKVLGIGVAGPHRKRLTLDGLVRALRACLEPEKAAAAQSLAGRIEVNGARRAAELLVQVVAG